MDPINIESLIKTSVFSGSDEEKIQARSKIRELANQNGIILSSINNLYKAFGKGEISGFTVPAFNIRTLTFDTARVLFKLIIKHNSPAVIFEIARSEMEYTEQRPDEYAVCILAGALASGYNGPVFIQGDHFQFKKEVYSEDPNKELTRIKDLTKESIEAGFYNIDIDGSTLVDLTVADLNLQQKNNYDVTADLTRYIRSIQPDGIMVSVGGEIGHIGGVNSTVSDFQAFMSGYKNLVNQDGISKVSVQTGSSHGGVPLPDGTIAQIKLDFSVLSDIGRAAREDHVLGGAVQHGASTLPNELFGKFPEVNTLEIHLATGFQNIVYDQMPEALRLEIYEWIRSDLIKEKSDKETDEQFIYKNRKKAFGPFKKRLWNLSLEEKAPILKALEEQFEYLFNKLRIVGTKQAVEKYT